MKGTLCLRFLGKCSTSSAFAISLRSFRARVALALFSLNLPARSPGTFCHLTPTLVTGYILLQDVMLFFLKYCSPISPHILFPVKMSRIS